MTFRPKLFTLLKNSISKEQILKDVIVQYFNLPVTTIESFFGNISNNITFSLPYFELSNLTTYIVPAFIIALLGSIESLLSAVVADGMIGSPLFFALAKQHTHIIQKR